MTAIWCGDPTLIAQNFGFLKKCNFDISVVHLGFGAILGDPKFGSIHVGSPHHMVVTGYTWLIVVINYNNEVCSCSNNTVSKAFWQKKVLPEQRISRCGVIYSWIFDHTWHVLVQVHVHTRTCQLCKRGWSILENTRFNFAWNSKVKHLKETFQRDHLFMQINVPYQTSDIFTGHNFVSISFPKNIQLEKNIYEI